MSQSPDSKKRRVVRGHPIHLSDARAARLGFWYDDEAADRVVEFFPRFLRHGKGKWAGKPFWLLPWQELDVIRPLFGWMRLDKQGNKTGLRRFHEGGIWVPKKNGKTPLGAGILLYCLVADGEYGAECFSAATTRHQAGLIYNDAVKMIKLSPKLKRLLKIYDSTKTIVDGRTFGKYQVLSGEAGSSEGINASCVCFDELHAQKNRKLYDALIYSGASREQPLFISLSTAGEYNPLSIGWEQFDHAVKVLSGAVDDPTFFAYVTCADKDDNWEDPKVWYKANPSLGVTISEETFREDVARAKSSPSKQASLLRYRFNIWSQSVEAWLNVHDWIKCGAKFTVDPAALVGRKCYGAIDLSKTTDLTCWALWFPGIEDEAADPTNIQQVEGGTLLIRYWIPESTLAARAQRGTEHWEQWVADGHLEMTPGDVVDYNVITEQIVKDCERYNPAFVGYDPWNAMQTVTSIQEEGFEMIEVRQTYANMSPGCKELERVMKAKRIAHQENPVLKWQVSNVVVMEDTNANIKPDRKKSTGPIDGPVCVVMGIGLELRQPEEAGFVYTGM